MSFNSQLQIIKAAGEDFEWYPTTNEIIERFKEDLQKKYYKNDSILDIGAGNGKVLDSVKEIFGSRFAIEKSAPLIQSLPKEIVILGADFWNCTLIDKEVTVIFSNPPYSEYETWVEKILKESNCAVYLVIPERWQNSPVIAAQMEDRKFEILGSFDFLNSEDRAARAKVHLLKISGINGYKNCDPFTTFFNENFKYPEKPEEKEVKESLDEQLVSRENFVDCLCLLYAERMQKLQSSFHDICKMPFDLLKEFGITKPNLVASLKMKIAAAKKEFWGRLFEGLEEIKKRLCSNERKNILNLLNGQTGIDFNKENIYAVVIFVLKNANQYIDNQLIRIFERMVDLANIENYKSNQKVFTKYSFRYEHSHIKLKVGHRIVIASSYMGLHKHWCDGRILGLSDGARNYISDLLTIANNLGFKNENEVGDWSDTKEKLFYFNKNGKKGNLFGVRCFGNGNMHLRINNDFIWALNIQHGKLKGWVNSAAEAVEEMAAPEEMVKYFEFEQTMPLNSNFLLGA